MDPDWQRRRERKREVLPLRSHVERRSKRLGRAIEAAEHTIAHPLFLLLLFLLHAGWMIVNAPWFPGLEPFDPYPYTFLATLASVEAPVITLLVLMRQHRERNIQELRDEVDLLVNMRVESETTALVRMLENVQAELGIEDEDDEMERRRDLRQEIDPDQLIECVNETLERSEH